MWDHIGKEEDNDSFEVALRKVEMGISSQTNQAVSRHKLFTKMGQGEKGFAVWYPTIREQALRCNFEEYKIESIVKDFSGLFVGLG